MIISKRLSGIDTRSDIEKQSVGERRSRIDRDRDSTKQMPSNEQLALFARRLRRTMRDEKGRGFFGVATGEQDFTFYPEVTRLVEWIDGLVGAESERRAADSQKITLRKAAP